MRGFLLSVPWFVPGLVASLVVAFVMGSRMARRLGCRPPVAVLLIASVGLILAATLTPLVGALEEGVWSSGACSTRRIGFAAPATYMRLSDATLNVLLFVPLGIGIALLPRSRSTAVVVVGALGLTALVEGTQMLLPMLGRGCETADIVDNVTGLVVGLTAGLLARRVSVHAQGAR